MLCYSLMSKKRKDRKNSPKLNTICTLLKKVIELQFDPIVQFLGTCPIDMKTYVHTKPCTQMLTAALFAVQKVCAMLSHSTLLQPHGLQPARLLCPWGFSRQKYWSGLPGPPPGDLPNPGGSNPGLLHCRQILYHLGHQGSPSKKYKHPKSLWTDGWGKGKWGVGTRFFFQGNENVLKLTVVTASQLCKYTRDYGIVYFTWVNCIWIIFQ